MTAPDPRPRDYALAILQAPNRAERQAILADVPEPWRALVAAHVEALWPKHVLSKAEGRRLARGGRHAD